MMQWTNIEYKDTIFLRFKLVEFPIYLANSPKEMIERERFIVSLPTELLFFQRN